MCGYLFDEPMLPQGIPIPPEIHDQYSLELKAAWNIVDEWVQAQPDWHIDQQTMPPLVQVAHQLILKALIPTYEQEGLTGADSCYMIGLESRFAEATLPVILSFED